MPHAASPSTLRSWHIRRRWTGWGSRSAATRWSTPTSRPAGLRMGDLAVTTSIRISTLTRLVDGMAKKRLVARRRAPDDARVILLHATDAGRRLTLKLLPVAKRYERVALRGFTPGEARALK